VKNEFQPFIINHRVDFNLIRLLDSNQIFHDNVPIGKAQDMAKAAELDLVCFKMPDKKGNAFCKILDYGKWKYSEEKKKKKNKQAGKKTTKELRFSLEIDAHDIEHKIKQAKEFFEDGDDVILSMFLKGRQRARKDDAISKIEQIVMLCGEVHETHREVKGSLITVRLSPGKQKTQGGKDEEDAQ